MVRKNINTPEFWDKEWSLNRRRILRKKDYLFNIVEVLIPDGLSVLELGCGTGRFLRWFKGRKIYGVDISPVAIEFLASHGIDGEAANLENFDYFDKKFDVIVISHTLEHIENDEGLVKNMRRIAKKFVIVLVPNGSLGPDELPEHIRAYTYDTLSALMLKYFSRCEDHSFKRHLILKCYV